MDAVDGGAAMLGDEAGEERRHLGDHRLVDLARHRPSAVALGQGHHPDRQRRPGLDLRQRRPALDRHRALEPHDLGGAAADVEQDHTVGLRIKERRAAGGGELGLGLAVDDLELEPDLGGDAGAKLGAVGGRAAGLGGDQPRAGDPAVRHLVAADAERVDRAGDRRVADAAGRRHPFAEPDDAGEGIDHAEAVAGRPRHQQPAIVGAEVERRVGRPRRRRPARGAVVTRVAVR